MLIGKYGPDCLNLLRRSEQQHLYRPMSNIMKSIVNISEACYTNCCSPYNFVWCVGNGRQIDFWLDNWHSSGILKDQFPLLFFKVKDQSISISNMKIAWRIGDWNSLWRIMPTVENAVDLNSLSDIIAQLQLTEKSDVIKWKNNNGIFSSALAYSLSDNSHQANNRWTTLRSIKIPHRIRLFLWQSEHQRLPTLVLLERRSIIRDATCQWCSQSVETQEHLFFDCSLATFSWSVFKNWTNFLLPSFSEFHSISQCFASVRAKNRSPISDICLASVFWSIWLARNDLIYKNSRISLACLEVAIKYRAYHWAKLTSLVSNNLESIWALAPGQAVKIQAKRHLGLLLDHWLNMYSYVGFIDGSFSKTQQSGIGGILINSAKRVKLLFSGPTTTNSSYEAEVNALVVMIKHLDNNCSNVNRCILFSDSAEMAHNFLKFKRGSYWDFPLSHLKDVSFVQHVNVIFISRHLNNTADWLAREGAKKSQFLAAWF